MIFVKAARYSKHGGPEVIEIVDSKRPTPSSNQILVENCAASVNPFDFKVRNGMVPGLPSEFPITIGGDFSGKIIELGSEVKNYKIGDEIYGQASVFGGASGSFAEFLVANPRSISLKPKNLDFKEAASLPLVGASAVQALHDHIELKSGQKILIQGGAGGIGSIAVQIAKNIGAFVVTTVSTQNVGVAKSLGADKVIDYKTEDFSEILSDYDAVFDTSGLPVEDKALKILKTGGILVSMTSRASEKENNEYGVKVIPQNTQATTRRLEILKDYVEKGVVKPQIEKIFTLDEAREAYEYQETQKLHGKVVVLIRN